MKKKITRIMLEQIANLTDKELCELSRLVGLDLTEVARELEPGKFLLQDRKKLVELLENRWRDEHIRKSITIAKGAFWVSVVSAIAAIGSAVAAFLANR